MSKFSIYTGGQMPSDLQDLNADQFAADRKAAVQLMSPNELELYLTDRAYIDDNFTVVSDPRGPVDIVMSHADPTAVWAWSGLYTIETPSWGFAWAPNAATQARWFERSDRTEVQRQHAALRNAMLRSARSSLWVSDILYGVYTRQRHTGIHWEHCDSGCSEVHGWIEIGSHAVANLLDDWQYDIHDLSMAHSQRREDDALDILEQYEV